MEIRDTDGKLYGPISAWGKQDVAGFFDKAAESLTQSEVVYRKCAVCKVPVVKLTTTGLRTTAENLPTCAVPIRKQYRCKEHPEA